VKWELLGSKCSSARGVSGFYGDNQLEDMNVAHVRESVLAFCMDRVIHYQNESKLGLVNF